MDTLFTNKRNKRSDIFSWMMKNQLVMFGVGVRDKNGLIIAGNINSADFFDMDYSHRVYDAREGVIYNNITSLIIDKFNQRETSANLIQGYYHTEDVIYMETLFDYCNIVVKFNNEYPHKYLTYYRGKIHPNWFNNVISLVCDIF